jgi:hypothetical protein
MAISDRAFHLLASERPEVFRRLVLLAEPGFLSAADPLVPEDLDESRLDLPPPIDADYVARLGEGEILHAEFQGYRDGAFVERLFRYHLALTLRYLRRRVRSVAVWLVTPPRSQRRDRVTISGVTVRFRSIVLPEVPASLLLSHPDTACFAPGAHAEGRNDEELCGLVARALKDAGASQAALYMACMAAAANGRYNHMTEAMQKARVEPVIVEELVRYGFDQGIEQGIEKGIEQGIEKGIEQGIEKGLRDAVLAVLEARELTPSAEERRRIELETDADKLRRWIARAAVAGSVDEALGQS